MYGRHKHSWLCVPVSPPFHRRSSEIFRVVHFCSKSPAGYTVVLRSVRVRGGSLTIFVENNTLKTCHLTPLGGWFDKTLPRIYVRWLPLVLEFESSSYIGVHLHYLYLPRSHFSHRVEVKYYSSAWLSMPFSGLEIKLLRGYE